MKHFCCESSQCFALAYALSDCEEFGEESIFYCVQHERIVNSGAGEQLARRELSSRILEILARRESSAEASEGGHPSQGADASQRVCHLQSREDDKDLPLSGVHLVEPAAFCFPLPATLLSDHQIPLEGACTTSISKSRPRAALHESLSCSN